MSSGQNSKLLLKLLNFLTDFDGEISGDAATLLDQLRDRSDPVPPLYTDVFGLSEAATCADLVSQIESFSPEQRAIASYAFHIFYSYEQMLRVRMPASPAQQAAYQAQLEQVRLRVARTKLVLAETIGKHNDG